MRWVVAALAAAGLAGAVAPRTGRVPRTIAAAEWQPRAGDVVLTATRDTLDAQIRGDGLRHSHVGLVVPRGDRLAIVEASPFGAGTVAYRDIAAFTSAGDLTDVQVVRPRAAIDGPVLAANAARLVAAHVPFDYALDADDPSRLYCSEMVADLLGSAGIDVRRLERVPVSIPFGGDQQVIPPDAFADDAGFLTVYRRQG